MWHVLSSFFDSYLTKVLSLLLFQILNLTPNLLGHIKKKKKESNLIQSFYVIKANRLYASIDLVIHSLSTTSYWRTSQKNIKILWRCRDVERKWKKVFWKVLGPSSLLSTLSSMSSCLCSNAFLLLLLWLLFCRHSRNCYPSFQFVVLQKDYI